MSSLKPATEMRWVRSGSTLVTTDKNDTKSKWVNREVTPFDEWIQHGRHDHRFFYKIDRLLNLIEYLAQSNLPTRVLIERYGPKYTEFIIDTVNFIRYGKRKMSIRMWKQFIPLMTEDKYWDNSGPPKVPNIPSLSFIDMWCSKPDGLRDMIETYSVIHQVQRNNS